jgi:predicted  nucleic acid-binding Zn-ribbon protein
MSLKDIVLPTVTTADLQEARRRVYEARRQLQAADIAASSANRVVQIAQDRRDDAEKELQRLFLLWQQGNTER